MDRSTKETFEGGLGLVVIATVVLLGLYTCSTKQSGRADREVSLKELKAAFADNPKVAYERYGQTPLVASGTLRGRIDALLGTYSFTLEDGGARLHVRLKGDRLVERLREGSRVVVRGRCSRNGSLQDAEILSVDGQGP
jgi:cytochrome c-type biogenesis protein CcmE